ncbi:MAG: hypothetical protein ACOZNI_36460 [Myxococcota bacterium]
MDAIDLPGRLVPDAAELPGPVARAGAGAFVHFLPPPPCEGCGPYRNVFPGAGASLVAPVGAFRAGVQVGGAWEGSVGVLAAGHVSRQWELGEHVRAGAFVLAGWKSLEVHGPFALAGAHLDAGGEDVRVDVAITPVTFWWDGELVAVPLVASELGVRFRAGPHGAIRLGLESAAPVISYRHVFGDGFVDVGVASLLVVNEGRVGVGFGW